MIPVQPVLRESERLTEQWEQQSRQLANTRMDSIMNISYPIIGIDIAKDKHDLAILHEDGTFKTWSIKGDENSLHKCAAQLADKGVGIVVLEATGGYEMPFMLALDEVGLKLARVNPMRVREFAKSIGQNSKTDREDAYLLALYGERARPEATAVPDEKQRQLKSLCLRRRQLVEIRAIEKVRFKQAVSEPIKTSIEKLISFLEGEIKAVEKELEACIESEPTLAEKSTLIRTFVGVGPITSFIILAELPELGHCGHRQLNALVGVAPYNDDSAKRQGQRRIKGGRFELRRALYMGAQTGHRHNPILKTLYDRLRKKGQPHKPALIACVNKMLGILNAMVKTNTEFKLDYAGK